MEICDIQLEENNSNKKVIITFCSLLNSEDVMTIKISVNDAWQIAKFCHDKLSYRATNEKNYE